MGGHARATTVQYVRQQAIVSLCWYVSPMIGAYAHRSRDGKAGARIHWHWPGDVACFTSFNGHGTTPLFTLEFSGYDGSPFVHSIFAAYGPIPVFAGSSPS